MFNLFKTIIINFNNNNYYQGEQIEMTNFDTQIGNYNCNINIIFFDKNKSRFSCGHIL